MCIVVFEDHFFKRADEGVGSWKWFKLEVAKSLMDDRYYRERNLKRRKVGEVAQESTDRYPIVLYLGKRTADVRLVAAKGGAEWLVWTVR